MKKRYLIGALTMFLLLGAFAQVDRSKLPEPGTPRSIQIGDYETFELKNGLKVFVIENHKLPRVSYNLILDREPIIEAEKAGYLSMVGPMMRRGTETRTKEQLDEEIDFIGASVGAGSTNVFASGLSKYNEKILELMTDIAFNPVFPEEELEKIRKQTISGLAASKDDPGSISGNLTQSLVYGKNHPYGEIQTEETTNNITVEDLKAYHKNYFKPNISYLAIVGDVDFKATKKLIKAYFGSWESADVNKPSYEVPVGPEENVVAIVNRSSSVQSNIDITYPVIFQVDSEDRIKARVMNQIFGGGSATAKLYANLREDKGYTYGSYSSLSADKLVGQFSATAEVRNEVTDSAIVQILYEMDQMKKGSISEEELVLAKSNIAGRFAQSLERPQTVARFALNLARYDLPADYYRTYLQKLEAVTKEDVQEMANKYLTTENAYITVVGKASEIEDRLSVFGTVKYFDNYGNEIDPALSKLPADLTVEQVLKTYEEALGGPEAIAGIENVVMNLNVEAMGQTLEGKQLQARGMKSRMEINMGGMTVMSNTSNGEDAVVSQMGNKTRLEGALKEEQIISGALFSELELQELGAELTLLGVESIGGSDAYGVSVNLPEGGSYSLYFDVQSGLKVRYSKVLDTPQGQMSQTINYSDYEEINGVQFPSKLIQSIGPQLITIEVSEIMVNQDLAEDTFKIE